MKTSTLTVWATLATLIFGSQAFCAGKFGVDRHTERGVACVSCHGVKNDIQYPSIDQCTVCHKPEQVVEKTKNVKPHNPHTSPHYGNSLDCALCHLQHGAPENYCNQCHTFDFKVK